LFAGVTLNGSTIRQDRDANERFYGIAYRTRAITIERLGGSPAPSADWRAALVKYAGGTP
jgi:lipid-binding SYLF domain-containing protein